MVGFCDVGLAVDGFDDDDNDVGLDVDDICELGLVDGFDVEGENVFVIVGKPVVGLAEMGATVLGDSLGLSVGATDGVEVSCNVIGFNDVGFNVVGDLVIGFCDEGLNVGFNVVGFDVVGFDEVGRSVGRLVGR